MGDCGPKTSFNASYVVRGTKYRARGAEDEARECDVLRAEIVMGRGIESMMIGHRIVGSLLACKER